MRRLAHIVFVFLMLMLLGSCIATKSKTIVVLPIFIHKDDGLSIKYFRNHHTINAEKQIVAKDFIWDTLLNGMKDSGKRTPIYVDIFRHQDKKSNTAEKVSIAEKITILKGYITQYEHEEYDKNGREYVTTKIIEYKRGALSGNFKMTNCKDSVLYQTSFKRGNGYWKDFHYQLGTLKEVGEVKNNYKIGPWFYYDTKGNIDSTNVYKLEDAVDVRSVYCFYNRHEPCD